MTNRPPAPLVLLIFLIFSLVILPVSATTISFIEDSVYSEHYTRTPHTGTGNPRPGYEAMVINKIQDYPYIKQLVFETAAPYTLTDSKKLYASTPFSAIMDGNVIGSGFIQYNVNLATNKIIIRYDFNSFDVSGKTGKKWIKFDFNRDALNGLKFVNNKPFVKYIGFDNAPLVFVQFIDGGNDVGTSGDYYIHQKPDFRNDVIFTDINDKVNVEFIRNTSRNHPSTVDIFDTKFLYYSGYGANDFEVVSEYPPVTVNVTTVYGKRFSYVYDTSGDPGDPGDPGESPTLRTGSVTMTDHNGTPITGFEVAAVNHYTGESYNVSTETDVAVMNLPMDRTIEIRNPQTGVYEEAPVGYYRFYGQKSGYKMLYEGGIQVSVMPEKYGSYKLCDILVTSDSGPLTGKHQFQLRSWSDNSILQTGTISAKSRTTGIWYTATVVNGLATLILPYDTSDALSEYAGQYYVYATSPGYEDIAYGVQITVYPRTVSEVRSIHLYPIGGVPTPGNVTLRIQAISETGKSVTNAEIFIAGVLGAGKDIWDTYTTSWTGFLEVSVPGNSTYDIVARGAGYYDSSRRIEVFTEDPPIIEMRLYLSGAPTIEPTTEPTGWVTSPPIGPTPAMTAPTGEHISSWLEWFAAHFGMILGGGVEIGKIFMWLCFTVPVGVYVGKEAKAGAAGFMAGAGIVTLFFVLIGWVPIWLVVLLALIIGLLYAKVFNTPDNGGGR